MNNCWLGLKKQSLCAILYTRIGLFLIAVDDIKYLTVDEQEKFPEAAKRFDNNRQFALLLETGMRTAELIGLTWDSIDWKKHTLTVSKSLEYRHSRTGEKKCLVMRDLVFVNWQTDETQGNAIRQFEAATPASYEKRA